MGMIPPEREPWREDSPPGPPERQGGSGPDGVGTPEADPGSPLGTQTCSCNLLKASAFESMVPREGLNDVGQFLLAWNQGDTKARNQLIPLVYEELLAIARTLFEDEAAGDAAAIHRQPDREQREAQPVLSKKNTQ